MVGTWVVVADRARARFFRIESPKGPLTEVDELTDPTGRLPGRELETDGAGRAFDSAGRGRHAMEKPTSLKTQQAHRFAVAVGRHLDDACHRGDFDTLLIVAAPAFLGQLRAQLSPDTAKRVSREFDKDLTSFEPADIRAHLPEII
jgi:protein required for attachment to host cells